MNANDQLREFSCTNNYYKHYFGILFTDGVKALCERFECFWFLDIVVSYQQELKGEEFQVWKLIKNADNTALVVCTDGNNVELKRQNVEYTDFKPTEATVWAEYGVILLPSEH